MRDGNTADTRRAARNINQASGNRHRAASQVTAYLVHLEGNTSRGQESSSSIRSLTGMLAANARPMQ
ncbi:hypothetical protein MHYP_G00121110 [Metynnis hypsauchen]